MEKLLLCRICLNDNVDQIVKNTDLEIVYEKLTAMPFQTDDMRPRSVCYMCYALLMKTHNFMLKCLRAEDILMELLKQVVNTEEEIDKTTLKDRLSLSSALSVSDIVTTSTADDDNIVGLEIEDTNIKQEPADEQDIDVGNEHPPESPEISIGRNTIVLEVIPDEQDGSHAISCKSEESHDTRDDGGDENDLEDFLDDHTEEAPVAKEPEFESQVTRSEVTNCVKDTIWVDIASDVDKAEASKLYKKKNISSRNTTAVTNVPGPSKKNNIKSKFGKYNDALTNRSNKNVKEVGSIKQQNKIIDVLLQSFIHKTPPSHTGRGPRFICNVCSKGFARKSCLESHNRIHIRAGTLSPKVRNQRFSQQNSAKFPTFNDTGRKRFNCIVCNKDFNKKYHYDRHVRSHAYDKLFGSRLDLQGLFPTNDKLFICNECNKSYATRTSLVQHIRIHNGDKRYVCNICNKRFLQKGHLDCHIRVHTGDKPFYCELCGKRFSQRVNLESHRRIHSGDKRFTCSVCKKRFSHKATLQNHMRTHDSNRRFICNVCNKDFDKKNNLKKHIRSHNSDERD